MTPQQKLRELGYTTAPAGVADFQRDFNLLGSKPVLVTSELDVDTLNAITLAFESRVAFKALRERKRGGHA
ncbi:hypothetical protein PPSIR1_38244 [Plesiocystis pacifica SIR-1]|uniref:Uncharacterized protein n=1 Tax=Plesiocystis pacifica SIR-1 TaxID=391625 RepID=A6GBS8_9BACT|nr:hypothetical protein [Plesiocystis pacifica]EDM74997.1 hypothetical protein PPSIR1_19102 [Plesiocystis pacifica SIR-1]EDM76695.1 hypothetical protein PPSIR1_38244 [Plesiocystis pacifica SIR-1]